MAGVNRLLVRYKGGFREVEDSTAVGVDGPAEGFLTLGDVDDVGSVDAAANEQLAVLSSPTRTVVAGIEPQSAADIPYVSWRPGDLVTMPDESGTPTSYRVLGVTCTEDENGYVTFLPELQSLLEVETQRTRRWLDRLASGTLNGRSSVASVASDVTGDYIASARVSVLSQVFSQQTVEVLESPSWSPSRDSRLTSVDVVIETPGTTATTLQVLKNGSPVTFLQNGVSTSTLLVPAGVYHVVGVMDATDVLVTELDRLSLSVVQAGDGAERLSVTCLLGENPSIGYEGV